MESAVLVPTIPIIAFSKTLKSSLRRQILLSTRPSPRLISLHRSSSLEGSLSPRQLFLVAGSVFKHSNHLRGFASICNSAALPLFGGGDGKGGDGDGGLGDGNGGDDGLGREKERSLGGKVDEASSPDSDVILLDVGGMSCGGCAASVKRILESQPQVRSANVNFATETAIIWASPDTKTKTSENWKKKLGEKLAQQLTVSGFKSTLRDSSKEDLYRSFERKMNQKLQLLKESGRELAVSWALCAVCLLGHMSHFLGTGTPAWIHILHSTGFHLSLSIFTFIGPGRKLILDGIKSLVRGSPNMNTLVGLGALSSFTVSSIAALVPKLGWKTFFEEPIMLIAFVLLGKNLELRAKLKATSDMTGLLNILPKKARLVIDGDSVNSSFVEVACSTLSVGDHVVVLPGDRVPVDGVVKSGRSTVDESSLTGEAMPVTKLPGVEVTAGSINLNGKLTIEVKRPGGETAMADIVRLVEEAQTREAPVQRLADKVAGNFTYGVMALSAATFTFWSIFGTKLVPVAMQHTSSISLALQLSCSVLVIACPCALGLATPTAVLVGTSLGARQGLLLRGGNVLEKFSEVDTFVFDKTGTLTTGKPVVTKILVSQRDGSDEKFSENEILSLAAGVESNTNHPIGKAITEAARVSHCLNLKAKDGSFKEQPGSGAVATVGQNKITVGTLDWLQSNGVENNPFPDVEKKNESVVYVGVDNKLAGLIYFEDKLRDDAKQVIDTLSKQGITTYMLSGDKQSTAEHIASLVGIPKDKVIAGVKPEEKRRFISQLQKKEKRVVAMVGDGINDAAALALSDVGVAMGEGVGAASDVSSVVLMGNRLSQVIDALDLSKETMKTVKQNLWWAFLYNIVGLPIAAGALLPVTGTILTPSIAGALMGFSSVGVMANSLLLRVKLGSMKKPDYNFQQENDNRLVRSSDVVVDVTEETQAERNAGRF